MTWLRGLEHVIREQEPLPAWNWLRLGGPARYFAEPTSEAELAELLRRVHAEQLPARVLGSGSNILIPDEGFPGVVIHLAAPAFCSIETSGQEIVAGGGAKLNHVVATAAREGLAGFEALVGIPGTVGGAVRGNAFGHGASIGQWTRTVRVFNSRGEPLRLEGDQLRFGYHESNLDDLVILDATFLLEPGDPGYITRQLQKLWIVRRAGQPTGEYGCCRMFADPRGLTAEEIIEQSGLKSLSVGGASISEQNANFVEVRPGATSRDVRGLLDLIREKVNDKVGVELVSEIEMW